MIQRYMTVKDVAGLFQKSEKTIRRWIEEGKDIRFDGQVYVPKKDPSGHCWTFIIQIAPAREEDMLRHPVRLRSRRQILSNGIK